MVTLRRINSKIELFQHSGTVEIRKKNNKIEKEQKTQQRQQRKPREKIPLKKAESNVLCAVNGSSKMRANITHQTQQRQSLGRFGPEN